MDFNIGLIYDCEPKFQARLESVLWKAGFLSFAFDNAEDFFEHFEYFPPEEEHPFSMPIFIGSNVLGLTKSFEILVRVKKEYPYLKIVMVFNGKVDQIMKDECIKLGASGFIDKHNKDHEIQSNLPEGNKERNKFNDMKLKG